MYILSKEIIYISGSFHKTQYTVLCWFMYHRRKKKPLSLNVSEHEALDLGP